jgi:hypothetical protein
MPNPKRAKTASDATGKALPAVKLNPAGADQITIDGSGAVQSSATAVGLVYVFATGAAARVTWGANPTASINAGSITVPDGGYFVIVKETSDKIACRNTGAGTGKLDIVPIEAA